MSRSLRFSLVIAVVFMLLVTGFTMNLQAQDEDKYGGKLNFPLPYPQSISTLEPAQSNDVNQRIVTKTIFDTIVKFDDETSEIKPDIAESWDVSEDGKEYTFYLREDITFHNGDKLTAEDVKFSLERMLDPEQASTVANPGLLGVEEYQEGEADHISGLEIIDDYTVKMTLKELDVGFLQNLANEKMGILPKDHVEQAGSDFSMNPVGSGPFKFVEIMQGEKVVVEAFEDYYGGRPYLDKIEFMLMPEAPTRVASYRSDQLDVDIVSPAQYAEYKDDPEYEDLLVEVPEVWVRCLIFNLDLEKFQDKRVRQAFNHAIDRKLIVEKLLNDKAYPATGWLPPSSVGYDPDLEGYDYDPEKAAELMEAAGYSQENPLEIDIIGTDNPAWGIPVIEAAMPYLEDVGFDVSTEVVDGATWSTRAREGDFEAFIFSLGGEVSPVNQMSSFFWSEVPRSSTNFGNYDSSEFDKYIEKAMETVDLDERMEYVNQAEKVLVEEAPAWFFNYNKAVALKQPWVHGVVGNAREMAYQDFARLWVDEDSPRK
ncbi:MAG: ABC transporter substrate-binding protein [Halanaerobiales bacterium]